MNETIRYRVNEDHAAEMLGPGVGVCNKRPGSFFHVRIVDMPLNDPMVLAMKNLQAETKVKYGTVLFYSFEILRTYTLRELRESEFLVLKVKKYMEMSNDVIYDDSASCAVCGSGDKQISLLRFANEALKSPAEIARTVTPQIIVRKTFAERLSQIDPTGLAFGDVETSKGRISDTWQQLSVHDSSVEVMPPTRYGDHDAADTRSVNECSRHGMDYRGIFRISEMSIRRPKSKRLVLKTAAFQGIKRGTFRPFQEIVISGEAARQLTDGSMRGRGFGFEIARIVDD